jgi:nitrogen regulatory protein PII
MSDGMKMAMVVYNEAMDIEVMEALERCGVKNYTKIKAVYGRGEASGTHMGDDVWPGKNNVIYAACDEPSVKRLLSSVSQLRKKLGAEGIKAFAWPLTEVT